MAVRSQPRFAVWADPLYVFPMPDETPFGLDRTLLGRPVIDHTGHASMNDNLRLQRLVLQLSEQVDIAVHAQDTPDAESASVDSMAADSASEVHDSIMGTAEAVFKEMSQQSYRADRALAVDQLWGCLSTYLDHCASLAQAQANPAQQSQAAEEEVKAAKETAASNSPGDEEEEAAAAPASASRDMATDAAEEDDVQAAEEEEDVHVAEKEGAASADEETAEGSNTDEEDGECAAASTAEGDADLVAAETEEEVEEEAIGGEEEGEDAATAEQAAAAAGREETSSAGEQEEDEGAVDLQQENERLRAQVQTLTARLAQHAQHAQQLLAGTEPFFGAKAGSLIGQALEEEEEHASDAASNSDSDDSFASARERALSRPLSASSSFRSADSSAFSSAQSRNLSVSPDKGTLGVSRGVPGGQVSDATAASIETAHDEVVSAEAQAVSEDSEPEKAAGQRQGRGKRRALRAFLHKLRPSLQTSRAVPPSPEVLPPALHQKQHADTLSGSLAAQASTDNLAQLSGSVSEQQHPVDSCPKAAYSFGGFCICHTGSKQVHCLHLSSLQLALLLTEQLCTTLHEAFPGGPLLPAHLQSHFLVWRLSAPLLQTLPSQPLRPPNRRPAIFSQPNTRSTQAPPSVRVRTLSRQFSQQDQAAPQARALARSLTSTPTRGKGPAMSSIWEQSSHAVNSSTANTQLSPVQASRHVSAAVSSSASAGAAAKKTTSSGQDKLGQAAPADGAFSSAAIVQFGLAMTADRALRKSASVADPPFAFGSRRSSATAQPLGTTTGMRAKKQAGPSAAAGKAAGAVFAFGSSAVPINGNGSAQVPFAFAAGAASAASAAGAANAFGQLLGLGSGAPTALVGVSGALGSVVQLAAGTTSAANAPQLNAPTQGLPVQATPDQALLEAGQASDTDGSAANAEGEKDFALPADLLDDEGDDGDDADADQSASDAEAADAEGNASETADASVADESASDRTEDDTAAVDDVSSQEASDAQSAVDEEAVSTGSGELQAGSEEEEETEESGEDEEVDESSSAEGTSQEGGMKGSARGSTHRQDTEPEDSDEDDTDDDGSHVESVS